MYQLITANAGSDEPVILAGIGTVHTGEFGVFGELELKPEVVRLVVECLQGPEEGVVEKSAPLKLNESGFGMALRWFFVESLRLQPGVWKLYLDCKGLDVTQGRPRVIVVKDEL
ncbi:MAG: hypothetical protein IT464_11540 [Planctomycetes bacterium]|nr:hypothetical protein [Planctomycetota bacterium]MCC7509986.1 hypothetical protein [Planctomycetota bacterium]